MVADLRAELADELARSRASPRRAAAAAVWAPLEAAQEARRRRGKKGRRARPSTVDLEFARSREQLGDRTSLQGLREGMLPEMRARPWLLIEIFDFVGVRCGPGARLRAARARRGARAGPRID